MKKIILTIAILVSGLVSASAQDKATITAGADLVSSYVWRGVYQNQNVSFQPTLSLGYKGLSIGAWGSTDISNTAKEFDLSAFYTTGALKIGLTDYWWSGQNQPYFKYKESHFFEGTLGYTIGSLSLGWNTMFAGDGDKKANGDQAFSTYIEAGYSFKVGDMPLVAAVGVTPWLGQYSNAKDGLQVASISLKATKELKISESVTLPVYVQGIIAPAADNAHLVVGVTF